MKAETVARIAAQAGDHYRAAAKAMSETAMRDVDSSFPWSSFLRYVLDGTRRCALSPLLLCPARAVTPRRYHAASFDAASFWSMSSKAKSEAEAKGSGFGVEIAWLTVARNAAATAIEIVRGNPAASAAGLTTGHTELLLSKIQERLAAAEKDNDAVYMNLVPSAKDLPPIVRAELAKPAPMPDLSSFKGPDMFASIVPVEVCAAALSPRATASVEHAHRRRSSALHPPTPSLPTPTDPCAPCGLGAGQRGDDVARG